MITFIIIIYSLALGSFANNAITAFLNNTKLELFRSKCLCGEKNIKFQHLFPIVSFLILKGKCAYCDKVISGRYLSVEVASMIVGLMCCFTLTDPISILLSTLIYIILLSIGVIDYFTYTIPNFLVLILMIVLTLLFFYESSFAITNILAALGVSVSLLFSNYIINQKRGIDIIGLGDIKLIFVLLLCISFPISLIALWLASFIAIPGFALIKAADGKFKHERRVPFGFFLAISYVISGIYQEQIINVYRNLF